MLLASQLSAQYQWFKIGNTKLTDSTNYFTMSRSTLIHGNLFVKGFITFDTLAMGKISYDGTNVLFENNKANGGFIFGMGDSNSVFSIYKSAGNFGIPIMQVDITGVDIGAGMTYKIAGTPITGGSTNLFGYFHKDTIFTANEHIRFPSFALYRKSAPADSVEINVKTGNLIINPTGTSVTFGSSVGTGTKNVYALDYYVGDSAYYNKTTTWSRINKFTADTTIAKNIKGLTGQAYLTIFSPGNGHQQISLANSTGSSIIYFYTGNGASQYSMDNTGFGIGSGTGRPFITQGIGTTLAVSYSFQGDPNTGLLWNSADNISAVTGGVAIITIDASKISMLAPIGIYNLTETQRDLLSPTAGWTIFNTDSGKLNFYNGSAWEVVTSAP